MYLISIILSFFSLTHASDSIKVSCEVKETSVAFGFTLVARLNVNQEQKTVNTNAYITLIDTDLETGEANTVESVVPSRGFYRKVASDDTEYEYTILAPNPEEESKILSIGLKMNIDSELQSTLQIDQSRTYYSNCVTVN